MTDETKASEPHRTFQSVPDDALERYLLHAKEKLPNDQLWVKDAEAHLSTCQSLLRKTERSIAEIEAEIQYRRDHPEAGK